MSKSPELLLPAGSLEVLKTAVVFGADAVYIGGEAYGLRAKAKNFTVDEMAEGICFAHEHGVKVYVTANVLAHDEDIRGAQQYFEELKEICPDALIISDPGMFLTARERCPEIPVHISTQANNLNYKTFRFWHELGASRVVTGRELSLAEIREIRGQIPDDLEIETFVHGAMCVSYSGRCILSNYLAGRDANRGNCAHPCRWNYAVMEETRPGEYMPLYENERGTFLFSSKDLCMVEHLPDLIAAGVDSLKVEGRMKSALYVASVGRAYRKALDNLKEDPELYQKNLPWYRREIGSCTHREFTTGFFYGKTDRNAQDYESSAYHKEYSYLGLVGETEADGCFRLEQRNKFTVGEKIEVMKPDGRNVEAKVLCIRDENGAEMESAPHAKQKLLVRLDMVPEPFDILRRQEEQDRRPEGGPVRIDVARDF